MVWRLENHSQFSWQLFLSCLSRPSSEPAVQISIQLLVYTACLSSLYLFFYVPAKSYFNYVGHATTTLFNLQPPKAATMIIIYALGMAKLLKRFDFDFDLKKIWKLLKIVTGPLCGILGCFKTFHRHFFGDLDEILGDMFWSISRQKTWNFVRCR